MDYRANAPLIMKFSPLQINTTFYMIGFSLNQKYRIKE